MSSECQISTMSLKFNRAFREDWNLPIPVILKFHIVYNKFSIKPDRYFFTDHNNLKVFQSPTGLSATLRGLTGYLVIIYPPEPTCAPTSILEVSHIWTCGDPLRYIPLSPALGFSQSTSSQNRPYSLTEQRIISVTIEPDTTILTLQFPATFLSASICFFAIPLLHFSPVTGSQQVLPPGQVPTIEHWFKSSSEGIPTIYLFIHLFIVVAFRSCKLSFALTRILLPDFSNHSCFWTYWWKRYSIDAFAAVPDWSRIIKKTADKIKSLISFKISDFSKNLVFPLLTQGIRHDLSEKQE